MQRLRASRYWPWLRDGVLALLSARRHSRVPAARRAPRARAAARRHGARRRSGFARGLPRCTGARALLGDLVPVCKAEQSNLDALARGLPVLSVASHSGSAQRVAAYVARERIAPRVIVDPRGCSRVASACTLPDQLRDRCARRDPPRRGRLLERARPPGPHVAGGNYRPVHPLRTTAIASPFRTWPPSTTRAIDPPAASCAGSPWCSPNAWRLAQSARISCSPRAACRSPRAAHRPPVAGSRSAARPRPDPARPADCSPGQCNACPVANQLCDGQHHQGYLPPRIPEWPRLGPAIAEHTVFRRKLPGCPASRAWPRLRGVQKTRRLRDCAARRAVQRRAVQALLDHICGA